MNNIQSYTDIQDAKILIIDSNCEDIKSLGEALKPAGFDIYVEVNASLAEKRMHETHFDALILDSRLEDRDPFSLCCHLKDENETKDIPILFVIPKDDSIAIARAFNSGAEDYAQTPLDETEILMRVRTQVSLSRSQAAIKNQYARLKTAYKKLKRKAKKELSSGLITKEEMQEQIKTNIISGNIFTLVLFTIDTKNEELILTQQEKHFVKTTVAMKIKSILHKDDIISNWKGSTLALIFKNTDIISARTKIQNIQNILKCTEILIPTNSTSAIVSAGISCSLNSVNYESLLSDCENSLYLSRLLGKGKIVSSYLN